MKKERSHHRIDTITASLMLFLSILFTSTACTDSQQATAKEYPVVLEIIEDIPVEVLRGICQKHGIDTLSVYAWEDHILIYDFPCDPKAFQSGFPEAEFIVYEDPYYIFDRSNCETGQTDGPWSHKILTANLVADPAMQQEYMDYHKNQFEQFPEVSAGFCRAEFQQLIMYRHGRQLMLIISYPAGEDYDTLNARTVTDNPRVDEWNSIMGQYQGGIEGTQPGETWVFFEPVF